MLKTAFGLDDADDPAAAMALNGGVAWSGGTCGAISGAAIAIGLLAARRMADHAAAKRVARGLSAELVDAFRDAFGALDCRTLLGTEIRTRVQHEAFLAGGAWREGCLRQIELAVALASPLADPIAWDRAVARLEAEEAH